MRTIRASALVMALVASVATAHAGAIHDANLYTGNTFAANDDGSTGPVNLGFTASINGSDYSQLFVNNNGNVTFGFGLSAYTPQGIQNSAFPIIAPFWADVDTRGAGSGLTQFGSAMVNGRETFGVNWIDVGYFASSTDKLNSFQLILTDRSDTGAGNFDIQFNYDQIQWETGSASNGHGGLGGTSAAVGYTVGGSNFFEFAGSRVNGAFLDSNTSTGLIYNSLGSNVAGQYNFEVRNGSVTPIPEPATLALMVPGLLLVAGAARRRKA